MLVVLEYIFGQNYRLGDLAEADLFEGLGHKVVLGRFAEKLYASSDWEEQSENLTQLAEIVPPSAKLDLYLADLIEVMTGPQADRPRPAIAREQPFFWEGDRWRGKVQDWAVFLKSWESDSPGKVDRFRKDTLAFLGGDWHPLISQMLPADMKRYIDKRSHDVSGLVTFVGNLARHVSGTLVDRYVDRIRQEFPQLFLYMYKNVR
jgi:hypothetical protein